MITALAGWHYPQRSISQNMGFFLSRGFDVFSAHGGHFVKAIQDPAEFAACGAAMVKYDKPLTVHYRLPNPAKSEEIAEFHMGIPLIADWQRNYGKLQNLTFDFWYDPLQILPYFKEALDVMEGTGATLACEDYPLTQEILESTEYCSLFKKANVGILIDVGHMHLRIRKSGRAGTLQDFKDDFAKLPLPVVEMHIHNNDGLTDRHAMLEDGCLPTEAFVRWAAAEKFAGVMTIESVPRYHGFEGEEGDAKILHDLHLIRKWSE